MMLLQYLFLGTLDSVSPCLYDVCLTLRWVRERCPGSRQDDHTLYYHAWIHQLYMTAASCAAEDHESSHARPHSLMNKNEGHVECQIHWSHTAALGTVLGSRATVSTSQSTAHAGEAQANVVDR